MEWVVTRGRTLEAALEAALDELGIDAADAEYEVLEEPRGGLLGRLRAGEYRVRVRVRPVSREKPRRRRPGKARSERSSPQRRDGALRSGGAPPAPSEASRRGEGGRPSKRVHAVPARGEEGSAADPATPQRVRGRQGTVRAGAGSRPEGRKSGNLDREIEGEKVPESTGVDAQAQAELACRFLAGLIEAMGLSATVRAEVGDDAVQVSAEGDRLGVLIGPRAATLYAIEDLTRAAVLHAFGGQVGRLTVDVAGYRAKRRAALEDFARRQVDRVRATGQPVMLEPMNAADRKVVHDLVLAMEGVTSSSEGEEPRRSVVIRPT